MRLKQLLDAAHRLYRQHKVAFVRKGGSDSALDFRGNLLNAEGKSARPVALIMVETTQPRASVPIRTIIFVQNNVPLGNGVRPFFRKAASAL
jgi:hypothetical protein